MVGGDYGSSRLLANANGTEPRVMMHLAPKGLELWIAATPWGMGEHRREFPGASPFSPTVKGYSDALIRMIRDAGLAKQAERERLAELREGSRK